MNLTTIPMMTYYYYYFYASLRKEILSFFQLQVRWNKCFDEEKFIYQISMVANPITYRTEKSVFSFKNSWSVSSRNLLLDIYLFFEEIILITFQQNSLEDIKNINLSLLSYWTKTQKSVKTFFQKLSGKTYSFSDSVRNKIHTICWYISLRFNHLFKKYVGKKSLFLHFRMD